MSERYFGTAPPCLRWADRGLPAIGLLFCIAASLLQVGESSFTESGEFSRDEAGSLAACDRSTSSAPRPDTSANAAAAGSADISAISSDRSAACRGGAVCSGASPTSAVTMRSSSGVSSSDPKPGTLSGLAKSHWFSAIPTKSRIVGSATHTRRSAARVSSSGTPGARNARMSLVEVIDSIGGKVRWDRTPA